MTTAYFDTSALIPLIVEEPSSPTCEKAWNVTGTIMASTLAYVETHTALAHAQRLGRLDEAQLSQAVSTFEDLWHQVATVSPSDEIILSAASLGVSFALRGYDAVHCASALAAASTDFFAISGDRSLLDAWHALGIATVDTNQLTRAPRGSER